MQPGYGGQQQPPLPQEAPWQAGGGQQPFEGMLTLEHCLQAQTSDLLRQSLREGHSFPCCRCASAADIWRPLPHRGTLATATTGTSAAATLGWLCAAVPRPAGKLLPALCPALADTAIWLAAGVQATVQVVSPAIVASIPLLDCSSLLADACWPCTAAIPADVPAVPPSAAAPSAAASWLEPVRPVPAELCLLRPAASGERWLHANGVRSA